MASSPGEDERRLRVTRRGTVAAVWLAGLLAGFYGLLAATARYGCAGSDNGLACHVGGSVVGVLIVVAVLAVVTAVTLLSDRGSSREILVLGGSGVIALGVCFVAARMLLASA